MIEAPRLRWSSAAARWLPRLLLAAAVLSTSSVVAAQVAAAEPEYEGADRVEEWRGKTILVVTPHPDDETFTSGGTLATLARNGNDIHILIYTSDNAGSRDPTMTHERLAAIRRSEEERACEILGLDADKITWLGHDDGMLEYVDPRQLTREVAREIRRVRPDAVFSVDPGAPYQQYHKSDHRAAAFITVDAIRAARWRLYFPELEAEGFEAWNVPLCFFYYSAQPNYGVDISDVVEIKARAAAAHFSQFGEAVDHYPESVSEKDLDALTKQLLSRYLDGDGPTVERFRRSTTY